MLSALVVINAAEIAALSAVVVSVLSNSRRLERIVTTLDMIRLRDAGEALSEA